MLAQIKTKVDLDKVTHSVRATQAVLQYGIGAMVDFPDQTLVTVSPEYWGDRYKIYDDRFAKALGVDYFELPLNVAYARFPEWYFCPRCRKFQPIQKWVAEYRRTTNRKNLEKDEHMVKHLQCPQCHQDLVVARIVTVCESGHLNDFPWVKWVHRKSKKSVCGSPSLKLRTGTSSTEGLEGIVISCSCGASATLKDAFDKNTFEELDKTSGNKDFICQGNHPHKHTKENCTCYPRTVQRGASSVYFPLVYSSLVIPPYSDKLYEKIKHSQEYEKCMNFISEEDPEDRYDSIKKRLPKWSQKIAFEIGANQANIEVILKKEWLEDTVKTDVASVKYRMDEYSALVGEVQPTSGGMGSFLREGVDISKYNIPHIKSISLIQKVRVVNALVGFSRITPALNRNDEKVVDVKEYESRSYPGYEVRGEGIFIEINNDDIDKWIEENLEVTERTEKLKENYQSSYLGKNNPKRITPKFIMLHTLSHLLITQLSFECGYNVASLSERIYCSEEDEGKPMSGIFIYTASGDAEGTLGGLVRQGRPDAFPLILKKAVRNAQICSNDPICILSRGQGRDSLNLAACHACCLLPETSCEERNSFLDRGMIIGSFENKKMGFWNDII